MRVLKTSGLLACALFVGATAAFAQNAPGNPRPANAKAICKDGTYTTSTVRDQACSRHGGVKQWLHQRSASDTLGTDTSRADTTHSRPSYPRPNCDTMLTGGFRCGPGDTLSPDSNRNSMNRTPATTPRDTSPVTAPAPTTPSASTPAAATPAPTTPATTTPVPAHRDTTGVMPRDTNDQMKDRGRNPDSTAVRDTSTHANANVQADRTTSANSSGATAKCKDGSWSHNRTKASTCTGHGGVDQWIGN